jgi:hypothetical protein
MDLHAAVISRSYDGAVRRPLATQLIVGIMAALVLDGGIMARVVGVAILGFWLCAAVIMVHRPSDPTRLDLALINWGFWPVLAIAALREILA